MFDGVLSYIYSLTAEGAIGVYMAKFFGFWDGICAGIGGVMQGLLQYMGILTYTNGVLHGYWIGFGWQIMLGAAVSFSLWLLCCICFSDYKKKTSTVTVMWASVILPVKRLAKAVCDICDKLYPEELEHCADRRALKDKLEEAQQKINQLERKNAAAMAFAQKLQRK
jgi:hypothetical protein